MPHVTIEYVIMVPVMILQIFLFPLTASWLMNNWVNSRRILALQEAVDHLGSTIQQMYFFVNHDCILPNNSMTQKSDLPPLIENWPYTGNATLTQTSTNRFLSVTLTLGTLGIRASTSVILGQNAIWQNSTFISNSPNAGVAAEKYEGPVIVLHFLA
jgi:hypothetical protein